jgi:DNA-binding MarR family transcriptional regulator
VLSALRKILRTTEQNNRQLMRETGLTPSQFVFMQLLEEGGEQTAGQLAARLGITQATATGIIHRLEELGMVRRRRGEKDRRQVWLSLTEEGRKALETAPDGIHARFLESFAALEDWEQLMLIAALERVAAMLGNEDAHAAAVLDASDVLAPRAGAEAAAPAGAGRSEPSDPRS